MSLRQRAILAGVMIFGAFGDVALSRGMKNVGQISLDHLPQLISAIFTPWVGAGIVLLLLFFISYLTALSFADLTYVLPATAIGYIIMALLAKFFLHEDISAQRWTGIALITLGVGFVTSGPARTPNARGMQNSSGHDDGCSRPGTSLSLSLPSIPEIAPPLSRLIPAREGEVVPDGVPQKSRFCSSGKENKPGDVS